MQLRCEECQTTAEEAARSWRALHSYDPDDPLDAVLVVFYCPVCAEAEFGPLRPRDFQREVCATRTEVFDCPQDAFRTTSKAR